MIKNPKILIIEDDPILQKICTRKLVEEGFKVSTSIDGEGGLAILKRDQPNLILLDLILPKMNGFEFLEKMKILFPERKIGVIVLSNLGQNEDIDKALKLGASDYLIKSDVTFNIILDKIKKYLGPIAVEKKKEQSYKTCSFCGNRLDPIAKFCQYCGKKIA